MLLLATPWVALILQPVAEHSTATGLAVDSTLHIRSATRFSSGRSSACLP